MKNKYILGGLVLLGIVVAMVMAGNVNAATINVPADYSTIQQAVDAASDGDTIIVEAGTYTEQLTINKSIDLIAQPGAKIVAPNNSTRNTYKIQESSHTFDPIVFVYGGTYSVGNNTVWGSGVIHVNISGFEINGNNDGVGDVYAGIFLRNVEGRIYNNYVHNMHVSSGNPQTFCIEGYGNSNIRVDNNTVMNYTRGGIVFNGDFGSLPDPYAIVENNTVVGNGLSDGGGWAENGIQIGWGASGIVQYNDVSANGWPGGNWAGTGILIAGTGEVTVRNNNVHNNEASISAVGYEDYKNAPCYNITFKNNQVYSNAYGIDVEANVDHVIIESNTIYDNDYDGVDIWAYNFGWESSTPDNITIQNNEIYNHIYCGIYLSDVYDNISIIQNDIHNNGEAIYLDNYYGVDSDAAIHYNNIHGNIYYGVWNNGNILVNATLNYWGDATGPYYVDGNHGSGDNVSDNVEYCPWLDAPYPGGNAVGPVQNINTGEYFCTIQDAIDDADTLDGDTIIVSAGIYDEQIIIDKDLTIQGQGDATIVKPSQNTADSFTLFSRKAGGSANTAAIVVANADATIKNLKIDGSEISSVPSGATFVGILYRGVNGTIDSVTVDYINISSGIGSNAIYLSSMGKEVNVEVKGCTISNFYKNGITANYEGLTVNIHDNSVIGSGPIANVAQNGIQIGLNAEGTIKNNVINGKGEYYTGSDWAATGILIYAANATVEGNTVINAQAGIDITGDYWGRFSNPWTVSIINNTVDASNLDASQWAIGIAVATYSDGEIINANIENNQIIGGAASDAGIDIGIAWYGCPGNVIFAVKDNSIDNLDYGMYIEGSVGSGSTITNNMIENNAYGIYLCSDANAANVTIYHNNIMGNSDYGVYNNGTGILNAAYNYWGDKTGPYNATDNPDGQGDEIWGEIIFTPWLDSTYPDSDYGNGKESPVDYANVTDVPSGTTTVNASGVNATIVISTSSPNTVTVLGYTGNPEGSLPSGAAGVGTYIDLSVANPSSVSYPIYLRINYTAADLAAAGITEDELLGIAYWDTETGCWVLYADTGVNTTNFGSYEGYAWAYIHEGELSPKVILGGTYTYPESHLTVTLDPNGYIRDASTFHIWATASSAWKIKYRIDGGEIKEGRWNEEVHFQLNKNWGYGPGKHTIEYWAVDPGTYEEEHHVEIYILDTNGPEVRISFDGVFEVTASNVYEISTSTKVMAGGEDDESGLAKIEYKIDNGEWQEYTAPFTMPSGYHELYVIGYDMLGNIGNMMHYSIDVGGGNPETALVTTPSEPDGNNGWYVSTVMVKLIATDDGSGVAKTMYRIDNGEWKEYTEPFMLDDGVHEISYYSIDNVGNVEMEKKATIRIDMYAPEINIEKPRNYLYLFNRAIIPLSKPVIIGKITFEVEIVDTATSGVNDAVLYIDGNVVEKGESKIQYTLDEIMVGRHTMKIVACDRAGNKAVMEDEFIILNIRTFPSLSS